jgi:hypothetical protein
MPLALATAIRFAPYIGGALLIGGAYLWAFDNGRDTEREKWQRQAAVQAEKVRERESELQRQVDAAGVALSEQSAALDRVLQSRRNQTKVYYRANPSDNVRCLTDDRLRAISDADQAAYAASAAK